MSTATAVKITPAEAGGPQQGDRSEIVQRAWRGLLQAHACLAKRLDAELERAHRLPMTSYEVLHHLERLRAAGACACATWPSRRSCRAAA